MTRRRWIADHWEDASASLTGDQALHLARVLRAKPGMRFDIVAGERVWAAEIASVGDEQVVFTLLAELAADAPLPLVMLLAVFKFDRLEWAIEKVTELGIARIIPVTARRTEKHLAQAAPARVQRWRRIAQEAAKQSRRSDVPAINDPMPFGEAVRIMPQSKRLALSEQEETLSLPAALGEETPGTILLAVGPEGGWAGEEIAQFAVEGWLAVSLGTRILRAETAAMAACAIVGAHLS